MDPLSLISNVIAVVGATQAAGRSLLRLKEYISTPSQIDQLLIEITETEAVLRTVQRLISELDQQPLQVDPVFNTYLESLVCKNFLISATRKLTST